MYIFSPRWNRGGTRIGPMVYEIFKLPKFSSPEMTTMNEESGLKCDSLPLVSEDCDTLDYEELIAKEDWSTKGNAENVDILINSANVFRHLKRYEDALDVYARVFSLGTVRESDLAQLIEVLCEKIAKFRETSFKNPSEIAICGLCSGILIEPLTLPCGHTYCKRCLFKEVEVICKSCKVKYKTEQITFLKTNVTVASVLEKIRLKEVQAAMLRLEGNDLYGLRDFLSAVMKYSEAEKLDPCDHLVQYDLSDTLLALGKPQEALDHAEKSIGLSPTGFKGYLCKGASLLCLGQHEEAIIAFLRCYTLENSSPLLKDDINMNWKETSILWKKQRTKLERIFARLEEEERKIKDLNSSTAIRSEEMGSIKKKDLECSLCIRLFWEPVTTPCGHMYCRTCLNRSLDHKPNCPLCKQSLAEYLAERRHATTELIETVMKRYLPEEYQERKISFQEELDELSNAGTDPEHGVPLFVCTLAYPDIHCPLHIFEPRYRLMTRQCMESGTREFGMCVKQEEEVNGIAKFGTMLVIRDISYYPDGRSIVDAVGSRRFRVLQTSMRDGYHVGSVEFITDSPVPDAEVQGVIQLHDEVYAEVSDWFSTVPSVTRARILQHFGPLPPIQDSYIESANGPRWMWWTLAILPIDIKAQVQILGIGSLKKRMESLQRVLRFVRRFGPQGISQ